MKFPSLRKLKAKRVKFASETAPLLVQAKDLIHHRDDEPSASTISTQRKNRFLVFLRFVLLWICFMFLAWHFEGWSQKVKEHFWGLPKDPHKAAQRILESAPVIVSCGVPHF